MRFNINKNKTAGYTKTAKKKQKKYNTMYSTCKL